MSTLSSTHPGAAGIRTARAKGWDELKAVTTLPVVFHHTAITYGAVGSWFYKEVEPTFSGQGLFLISLCTVDQAWFMGLFFLLAGRFTPGPLERKGRWSFLRDRLLRLGVPLLVFGLWIGPATLALGATAEGHPFFETFTRLLREGRFEPGPMWFAQALLIFSAFAMFWPASAAMAPTAFPSDRTLLLSAVGCGIAAFMLRLRWPVGDEVEHMQPGYFASYVILFVAGFIAARRGWLEELPSARVRRWRRVAAWSAPLLLALALLNDGSKSWLTSLNGGWNIFALTYSLWEPFVAWGVILGLLRFFSHARFRPFLSETLSRRAYGVFVIHPPVVVAVALAWRQVEAPPSIKFVVTGSVACIVCVLAVGFLLRVPGVRRIL